MGGWKGHEIQRERTSSQGREAPVIKIISECGNNAMRTSPRGLPKKLNDLKFNELARPLSVHTLCICSLNRARSRHPDPKAEKLDALDVSARSLFPSAPRSLILSQNFILTSPGTSTG
jgi:hypothetical protein